jgi:hypothetical protein
MTICLVAILKNENRFLDEWLIYHRLIGIDHFFLYDDDASLPLKKFLAPHNDYVTVIDWWQQNTVDLNRRGNQLAAYQHAVKNYIADYNWVVFLDGDEFIALYKHIYLKKFLAEFQSYVSISLNWHVFGHNGFFNDPTGLITSSLNRRMFNPFLAVKTITKTNAIYSITTAHYCELKYGKRVDANQREYVDDVYEGKAAIAAVNHYLCRSFKTWMKRVERGDVNFVSQKTVGEDQWRFEKQRCLERFVRIITRDNNEYVDNFMMQFKYDILENLNKLNRYETPDIKNYLKDYQLNQLKITLNSITDELKLKIEHISNIGLINGKAGIAIFLFHYSKFVNDAQCHQIALKLLDDIIENITEDVPIDYNNGLAGFGLTVEYLASESFIKIDTDEMLEDIDVILNYHLIKNNPPEQQLYKNILQLGGYFVSRFNNPVNYPYSHREPKNRLLLDDIIKLVKSKDNSYYKPLNFLNFLCEYFIHSSSRQKTLNEIQREIEKLNDLIANDDRLFEKFDPLYAAEILFKFSKTTEDKFYYQLGNTILDNYEQTYWEYVVKNLSANEKLAIGLRYLHLSKILQREIYANKGLACLEIIFNINIDTETDIKKITGCGLVILLILSEWREGLFDISLLFAVEF